jgi:hypothetical protein
MILEMLSTLAAYILNSHIILFEQVCKIRFCCHEAAVVQREDVLRVMGQHPSCTRSILRRWRRGRYFDEATWPLEVYFLAARTRSESVAAARI